MLEPLAEQHALLGMFFLLLGMMQKNTMVLFNLLRLLQKNKAKI